jgi:hypothetical protein
MTDQLIIRTFEYMGDIRTAFVLLSMSNAKHRGKASGKRARAYRRQRYLLIPPHTIALRMTNNGENKPKATGRNLITFGNY